MSWDYAVTRLVFQRALAFVYCIGFLIIINQFRGLLGTKGLLPVPLFLKEADFSSAPSLFWLYYSDIFATALGWLGLGLGLFALSGFADAFGMIVSVLVWGLLWVLYLSFVNVGQTFYSFGWESLLLETGFLAIFLGSRDTRVPVVVIWMLRWLLFRLMFGAGMIKLRGDPCWRDLTCMFYHYETQPMPNPLSWSFHHLPRGFHKFGVLFTHFVELVVPWFYFAPGVVGAVAGGVTVLFQIVLILSGNLSWLNYMSLVLCIACFDDSFWLHIASFDRPSLPSMSLLRQGALGALALLIGFLSIRPAKNLLARAQLMNSSFDPLHLVNTYGAFGSITRKRQELIIEGTRDEELSEATQWQAYEFRGKPGDLERLPPVVSPYHLRLDWQMWFAAMDEYYYHPWLINLLAQLLAGNADVLGLLRHNPFPGRPPTFIRIEWYRYQFTAPGEAGWWKRERVGSYLGPLDLAHPGLRAALRERGWTVD